MFYFPWLIDFFLSVDDKMIGFKGIHVDKIIITYKNKGGGFKVDDIFYLGFNYNFY